MKILLTGASGYLGRHVLAHLREQGIDVVVLGRSLPVGFDDVPLVHCDLLDGPNLAVGRGFFLLTRPARIKRVVESRWVGGQHDFGLAAVQQPGELAMVFIRHFTGISFSAGGAGGHGRFR